MRHPLLAVLAVVVIAGCTGSGNGGGGGDGDGCPLDGVERQIVEEVVFELILNAATVAEHNVGSERAFGVSLPASTVGNNGFFFDVTPCTTTTSSAPVCFASTDPGFPFFEEHDACVQLACEGPGVALVDAFFTMQPQQTLEPRHVFTYETDQPAGTAVFAENPRLLTRVELIGSASNIVSADFDFDVTIQPEGHGDIAFQHTGSFSARNVDLEVTEVELEAAFADLAGGTGVSASFVLGSGGTISAGGAPLATISDDPAPFTWLGECAN